MKALQKNLEQIDLAFAVEYSPIVWKEQWIQGNVMLLSELGTEDWLQLLHNVLEGDFVTAEDIGLAAPSLGAGRIHYHISKKKGRKRKKSKT